MKNQFVTYEIALKLKELGFEELCFGLYKNEIFYRDYDTFQWNEFLNCIKAPLWQQVIDWFREKHKINIFFDCEMNISSMEVDWFKYRYKIYIDRIWSNKGCYNGSEIYEEAREQAILKAIELYKKNYHKN